ncbi:MAG: hypothetical protein WBA23_07920 [Tunicatimonas sp.]|uniref:hypothetical protein n=1 Tax=Tunicatimonas sp. TaxID=1940096 RepID=UPI003C773D40
MSVTEELEIKLYQLLKEGNWSDDNAQQAVNTIKGLQKEANKELLTKEDFLLKSNDFQKQLGEVQTRIIIWVVSVGATLATITIGAMVAISKYL